MKESLPRQIFQNLIETVLFVFCAVPGAFITAFSVIGFFLSFDREHSAKSPVYLFLWFILGTFLVLVGLRKTKQPLYLLVIWSFPFLICAPVLLGALLSRFLNGVGEVIAMPFFVLIFVVPFLVKKRIDRFYAEKAV